VPLRIALLLAPLVSLIAPAPAQQAIRCMARCSSNDDTPSTSASEVRGAGQEILGKPINFVLPATASWGWRRILPPT